MATGHRKEEKEGHTSELFLSPGFEVSGTGHFCMFLELLREDQAYKYLGVEPRPHQRSCPAMELACPLLTCFKKLEN